MKGKLKVFFQKKTLKNGMFETVACFFQTQKV